MSLPLLTYARVKIGQYIQVAHLTHIRWKVPHDNAHGRPAHCHIRRLANIPTRHPGSLPLLYFSPSAHVDTLATYLQTLYIARLYTHHSRRTHSHLTAPIRAGRPIWRFGPEQSVPASHGAHRGASTCTRPPSQAVFVRRGHR
jgi:hypothetical protein